MTNQIEITIDIDKLTNDYPNGNNNIPNPANYISYEIISWTPDGAATAIFKDGEWDLTIPSDDSFTWYAIPKGKTINCEDILLGSPSDSRAFQSEEKDGGNNSYECTMKDFNSAGENTSDCTLSIIYPVSGGKHYRWDPKIVIDR